VSKFEQVLSDKTCRTCKNTFHPRKADRVYCSMACYLGDVTKHKQRNCAQCGISYKPYRGINSYKSKYCSVACSAEARINQQEKKCRECGKSFLFKPSQSNHYRGAGKYCSRDCSYAGIVKDNAKKPIKDKYGRTNRKADVEWSKAIKERDNYTCQRCGVYSESGLHAHHKATRGAHPELKHNIDNGVTLCNSCHTWVHKNPKQSYELGWLVRSGN
jgi:hypothetical protein